MKCFFGFNVPKFFGLFFFLVARFRLYKSCYCRIKIFVSLVRIYYIIFKKLSSNTLKIKIIIFFLY